MFLVLSELIKKGIQILMGRGPLASQDETYPDEKYSPRHKKKSMDPKLSGLSSKIYRLTNSRVCIDSKPKLQRRAYIFSGSLGSCRQKRSRLCFLWIRMLLDSFITFFCRFFEYRKDIIQELSRILDFKLKPALS